MKPLKSTCHDASSDTFHLKAETTSRLFWMAVCRPTSTLQTAVGTLEQDASHSHGSAVGCHKRCLQTFATSKGVGCKRCLHAVGCHAT